MKKSVMLFTAIISLNAIVQAQEETQNLIGMNTSTSGFGGIMTELSWVKNQPVLSFGGGGGVLFDQKFFIGGYGMGNLVEESQFSANNQPVSLEMGHGGLWLGYHHKPHKLIHFGASTRIGAGGLAFTDANGAEIMNDGFFVATPQLHAELNVLPFMRINLTCGYRAAIGLNNAFISNSNFSSPIGLLGFYFGWFGD